jgi:hypothetical protein
MECDLGIAAWIRKEGRIGKEIETLRLRSASMEV